MKLTMLLLIAVLTSVLMLAVTLTACDRTPILPPADFTDVDGGAD